MSRFLHSTAIDLEQDQATIILQRDVKHELEKSEKHRAEYQKNYTH